MKTQPIGYDPEYCVYEKIEDGDDDTDKDTIDYESDVSELEDIDKFKSEEEENKNYTFLKLKTKKPTKVVTEKPEQLLTVEEYID